MINITHNKGNINQNHNEVPLHTHQDGYRRDVRAQKRASVDKDMEKLDLLGLADGNVKWCSCSGQEYGSSSEYLK